MSGAGSVALFGIIEIKDICPETRRASEVREGWPFFPALPASCAQTSLCAHLGRAAAHGKWAVLVPRCTHPTPGAQLSPKNFLSYASTWPWTSLLDPGTQKGQWQNGQVSQVYSHTPYLMGASGGIVCDNYETEAQTRKGSGADL